MESNCPNNGLSGHDKAILNRIFNPHLPYADVVEEGDENLDEPDEEQTETVQEAKRLEAEGVEMAEKGDPKAALDKFKAAIEVAPERASGYNNRAQALRLVNDVDGAMKDLNKAVELSSGKGKAACQAYTQRALIKRLQGEDDDALEDFKKAAALGSEFAKAQVITLNPYAAMCNAMMMEMVSKVKKGEIDG